MNTDPTPLDPDEVARREAALRETEARLRRTLSADAARIEPTDRLAAILTEAHDETYGRGARRRLAPAAAAAAALLLAGTVWAVNRPTGTAPVGGPTVASESTGATTTPTSAGPSSSTPSPSSSAGTGRPSPTTVTVSPTGSPEVPPTVPPGVPPTVLPTTGSSPSATRITLPVYYLGPVVPGSEKLRLFREFVPEAVPAPGTPGGNALAALRLAFGATGGARGGGYASPWSSTDPTSVTVGDGRITVALSRGLDATPDGGSDLAIQQIVWTAQAAVGQGALPVRITVPGDAALAPGRSSTRTWNRPTDPLEVASILAPVWVDEPFRGEVVPAGQPLVVNGIASTFEANVEWQLLAGGTVVDEGFTTATVGAPGRGTYAFETEPLGAGPHVLRVFESSAKDGSVAAEQRVSITAR
jgi:hypothetical protein